MTKAHTVEEQIFSFNSVEQVVADSLRFKRKLEIGGDAYASIRIGKSLQQIWDIGGVAATGGSVAASSAVAGTLFASGGWMSAIGLGAAATTPVGWIVCASVVSGSAYYGVTRLFKGYGKSRVETIPKFINTPIDLLGASLMDLLGGFAFKVASIDGMVDVQETNAIKHYFVTEWGYDALYTESAMMVLAENSGQSSISEMTKTFADFARSNPDCNFEAMRKELILLLSAVAAANNTIDERETLVIDKITQILDQETSVLTSVRKATSVPAKVWGWLSKKTFRKTF